jgi:transposase
MDFDPVNVSSDPSSIHLSYGGNGIWRSMADGRAVINADSQMYIRGADYSKIEQNAFNIAAKSLDNLRPVSLSSTWSQEEGFFTFLLSAKLGGKQVAIIKHRVHAKSAFEWL